MPNIYIVNDIGHDYSSAMRYLEDGKIIKLSIGTVNIFSTDRLINSFEYALRNFQSEDMLLLSGNSLLNVIAAAILAKKNSQFKVLIWDAREAKKKYHLRTIKTKERRKTC